MAVKVSGTTVIDNNRNADVNTLSIGGAAVTATAAELNILDGATVTTAELNYLDGVTSPIQTQLDSISVTAGTLTKSFANGETASITLSSAISPAPVVSVTKEVPQVGVSSKGAWDVATTGANYTRLDSAYDTTLTPAIEGWDVSTASYLRSFSVSGQETDPSGISFKPDGTVMYIIGATGRDVNQYSLSTAWNISTASYVQNFSVAAQTTAPTGIFFKPDGLKMYTCTFEDNVDEYNLSTAWDISTASYLQSFSVATEENDVYGVFFKPDGTKMFTTGQTGDDVNEYNLSTAWDVSTASYSQNFSVAAQETAPREVFFKPDGTKMYILGVIGDDVNEYTLSTAWDISTASYTQTFYVGAQDSIPDGLFFKPDGTKMYMVGRQSDTVHEYNLDATNVLLLGTGSFASTDVGKTLEGNGGVAVLTATDGSYVEVTPFNDNSTIAAGSWGMFGVVFDATGGIKGSVAAVNTWDISTASYLQTFSVAAQESLPSDVFFKPDGLKMYVVGFNGDDVNEYNLSTAWDISTASYVQTFSVAAQEIAPNGIFFKPDGTKMYIGGDGTDAVLEYNLSTAWDVSSASYSQSFSFSAQENQVTGIFFKPDGLKVYMTGLTGDDVNEYNLSTAWDISTASYLQNFSFSAQEGNATDVFFKSDGLKMYVLGEDANDVNEYNLSTAWDISTASYVQTFSVNAQETNPRGMFFKPDGLKMYVIGYLGDAVYEYDIGTVVALTAQYTPSITNASGQINSTFWLDINSMTADQSAGDGEVYYAVSTDDHTTWSVIHDTDGVRPIVRNNAGTWEVNDSGTYSGTTWIAASINSELDALQEALATAAQVGETFPLNQWVVGPTNFNVGTQDGFPEGIVFNNDGTKMYMAGRANARVYQYSLSTAFDITTASYDSVFLSVTQDATPRGIVFNPDGTKMYIAGGANNTIFQYNLSTAFDLSTASYSSISLPISVGGTYFVQVGRFNPDGTKLYVFAGGTRLIYQYSLTTAYDLSTATYDSITSPVLNQDADPKSFIFNGSGTKMYLLGDSSNLLYQYSLSTAFDITTISYDSITLSGVGASPRCMAFDPFGTKLFVVDDSANVVIPFTTGQILTFNRMDKTQLEAVTDPNHYTLGDTLDLMIALYLGSASASVPSSDGVSINYDAQALNKGAVLGTDYDFDFPDSTTVRITSNAAQNLKIRVV